MVSHSSIEAQLAKLGIKRTFFSRPEIRELQRILMDHENIIRFVQGRYSGGFAILVATEQRLLLVDKKPLYLTVEDIRYDMISEVDINARLFDASVRIFTVNKCLIFTAVRQQHLRQLVSYIQQRVMELRQYHPETPAPAAALPQAQSARFTSNPQYSYYGGTQTITQPAEHLPHVHMPNPIPAVLAHTRDHIPTHMSQAIGSAATRLASRLHNPNPYTKAPLITRRQWSSWPEHE